ncbi:MAG: type II toxin-antitoxin system HicB family antitoxin [Lachnospiraceae bacterium]|nr:type II toxin-antitoxin system HicB family antitoxin [Lachnospiraceae bacterium]
MKCVYSVFFTKTKKNVLVEVPDLEILTEGKNMADAIYMARDAIGVTGIALEDDGQKIPKPSDNINIKNATFKNEGETIVSMVDIDFLDYRRSIDNKIVRRNVSLPNWLDRECEKRQINVSKMLQDSLIKMFNINKPSYV